MDRAATNQRVATQNHAIHPALVHGDARFDWCDWLDSLLLIGLRFEGEAILRSCDEHSTCLERFWIHLSLDKWWIGGRLILRTSFQEGCRFATQFGIWCQSWSFNWRARIILLNLAWALRGDLKMRLDESWRLGSWHGWFRFKLHFHWSNFDLGRERFL